MTDVKYNAYIILIFYNYKILDNQTNFEGKR